jgi:hypothetical protein
MNVSEVNQFAHRVIMEDDVPLAVEFLTSPQTQRANAIWFVYQLMQWCSAHQAVFVSHLANEFLPEGTPTGTVWLLRRYEFKMYRRLKNRHGVDQCLRRYLSMSPERRALLRSLGNGGLFDP